MASAQKLVVLVGLVAVALEGVHGHGMLMEPVNRGSAWKKGFKTPVNYDDDGNYCGGLSVHINNGGKCGVCGDDYRMPQPRPNENTGTYGQGVIVKTYDSGAEIELEAVLTANHRGFMRYSLCPLSNSKEMETEECFDSHPIKLSDDTSKYLVKTSRSGSYKMKALLPPGLTCEHCVLRWEYVAGNNWGICEDGVGRMGCGPQETFRTCSDIKIL